MPNVKETRNAHNKARNSTKTLCFPSLSFDSSRGRSGVVSSGVEVGLVSCVLAILWFAGECEGKAWYLEKSYRNAQGELTNALRQLRPGIGGIAAARISRTTSPRRLYEAKNVYCMRTPLGRLSKELKSFVLVLIESNGVEHRAMTSACGSIPFYLK